MAASEKERAVTRYVAIKGFVERDGKPWLSVDGREHTDYAEDCAAARRIAALLNAAEADRG